MSRIAYVNGRYVPQGAARVSIEDRGYQFADGVYEVIEVRGGRFVDEASHLARLSRSLGELKMTPPLAEPALALVLREVVRRNGVRDGMAYLQVTRGVAARDHAFPDPAPRPALVITARAVDPVRAADKAAVGMKVITLPDLRWKRPDIKSISLLPNVLAKAEAKARGAGEAWLYDEAGLIHEGAASNAWIVAADGRLVTHPPDRTILKGVTRTTLLALIAAMGHELDERGFTRDEAWASREAFTTGATTLVMPVVAIDDRPIGDGRPGPVAMELRARFHEVARLSPR